MLASLLAFTLPLIVIINGPSCLSHVSTLVELECFKGNGNCLRIMIILDLYALVFLMRVCLISSSVLFFSSSYIQAEPFFIRFHLLVLFFILSIILLITSPNLIRLLLGWDGLGLTSYLLVVFFQSQKSYNAGIITALSNRIGDVLILTAIRAIGYCLS